MHSQTCLPDPPDETTLHVALICRGVRNSESNDRGGGGPLPNVRPEQEPWHILSRKAPKDRPEKECSDHGCEITELSSHPHRVHVPSTSNVRSKRATHGIPRGRRDERESPCVTGRLIKNTCNNVAPRERDTFPSDVAPGWSTGRPAGRSV